MRVRGASSTPLSDQGTVVQLMVQSPQAERDKNLGALKGELVDAATPHAQVSAFCHGVLARLFPNDLFGIGPGGQHNRQVFLRSVDQFIRRRRFEDVNLHSVCQGVRMNAIAWLDHPHASGEAKRCLTDTRKRELLFHELMFFIFDSVLTPLLRSNFYITESSAHKHKHHLFYFRHDVWKELVEPKLSALECSMFDRVPMNQVRKLSAARLPRTGRLRLVPKGTGVRPIMNLRHAKSFLKPVHSMLTLEKERQGVQLGSSIFCVADIFPKLLRFRDKLRGTAPQARRFYFVKVDVQASFDRIPQCRVLELIKRLSSEKSYRLFDYTRIEASSSVRSRSKPIESRTRNQRFLMSARGRSCRESFHNLVETSLSARKRRAAFVQNKSAYIQQREELLERLQNHVEQNIVKIDGTHYRQKQGIPQGSTVSSLLCSFLYGDFERARLGFLREDDSLLVRLIDDFLLITTKQDQAEMFMQTMTNGDDSYGIRMRTEKSLVNFACRVNGISVPRVEGHRWFPYCGALIDMQTLDLSKDRGKLHDGSMSPPARIVHS